MEVLGYVLQHEWRLSTQRRQRHLDRIKRECSPKILKKDSVIILERNKKLSESSSVSLPYSNDNNKKTVFSQEEYFNINKEVIEMKNEIKELRDLLKSHLNRI